MPITAGDVIWNITGETKQLAQAMTESRGMASNLATTFMDKSKAIGAAFTAMGGGIIAAAVKVAGDWAQAGDAIGEASQRVGIGTESLSVFKHMAEQSGASLGDFEAGIRRMSRFIVDGGAANEEAMAAQSEKAEGLREKVMGLTVEIEELGAAGKDTAGKQRELTKAMAELEDLNAGAPLGAQGEAVAKLGLDIAALRAMKPEEAFWALGEAINAIEDPMERAAIAQEVFGKGGVSLLPLIEEGRAGFARFREEVERMGLLWTPEDVARAEKYADTMDNLSKSFQGAVIALGPLVAEHLQPLAEWIIANVPKIKEWATANQEVSMSLTGLTLSAAGVAAVLGPVLFGLNQIIATLKYIFGAVAMVVSGKTILIGVLTALQGTIVGVTAAMGAISAMLTGTVAGAFALVAGAVGAAAVAISSEWANVQKLFSDFGEWLVDSLSGAFNAVLTHALQTGMALVTAFVSPLDGIKMAFESTIEFVSGALSWLKQQALSLASLLADTFGNLGVGPAAIGDAVSGMIPGFAAGGTVGRGGIIRVGERGPETMFVPAGTKVAPHDPKDWPGAAGANITVNVDRPTFMDDGMLRRFNVGLAGLIGEQLRAAGAAG